LPQILRLPQKRGFTNIFTVRYNTVNLKELAVFPAGSDVTPEKMYRARLVGNQKLPVKILATGDMEKSLNIKANKFSAAAKSKIEAAGGTTEEIGHA
jgi:large subunit ribosomal protein L15